MFLPVLLVRDYGLAAWFVFAVPNIIGAAAMGWVMNDADRSRRLLDQHHVACVGFSAVTLAFHAFFLFWLGRVGIIPPMWCAAAVVGGTVLGLLRRAGGVGLDWLTAWIALLVSFAVLAKGLSGFSIPAWSGLAPHPAVALAMLTPVCAFGFFLCPYLDVTFHRAVQQTTRGQRKAAFAIGFGLFFLAMIFLTLLYAGDFSDGSLTDRFGSFGGAGLITWVAAHMAVQIGFTWSAHLRALPTMRKIDRWIWLAAAVTAIAAIVALAQIRWFDPAQSEKGEMIYRIFMGFYALVFPAYVWICVIPGVSRRTIQIWAVVVLLAAPMFALALVGGKMIWLAPALLLILIARPRTRRLS